MNVDELEIPIVRESVHGYRLAVGYAEASPRIIPMHIAHTFMVVLGIFLYLQQLPLQRNLKCSL